MCIVYMCVSLIAFFCCSFIAIIHVNIFYVFTLLLHIPRSGNVLISLKAEDCKHWIASKRKSCSLPPFETLTGGSANKAFNSWTGFTGLRGRGLVDLSTLDILEDSLEGIIFCPKYKFNRIHLILLNLASICKQRWRKNSKNWISKNCQMFKLRLPESWLTYRFNYWHYLL